MTGTFGCVAIAFSLNLAACGDDKSSSANDDEIADDTGFTLEELEELGIGIYESADDLKKEKCGEENEYESVYVKADSSFYLCYGNKWTDEWGDILSVEIGTVESSDKLGECNEENEGQMIRVPRDTIFDTYACEDGEWVSDFGGNSGGLIDPETVVKGTFKDERDGKTYKTVKIGDQTWMAENLNYKSENSFCYKDNDEYCEQYGRLYAPAAVKNDNICPDGWRLPTIVEWNTLYKNVGNNLYIGVTDPYEFNISLGGYRDKDRYYSMMGLSAGYWARSGRSLVGIKTVNTRLRDKRNDYPWTKVSVIDSNNAMYMRCIKK